MSQTRFRLRMTVAGLVVAVLTPLLPIATEPPAVRATDPATVSYSYDAAGRLRSVNDDGTDVATYAYDSAGNVTAIARPSAGTLAIIDFHPHRGRAVDNTVEFNGTEATVTSASPTRLIAEVPAAATTGPIIVTTSGGTVATGTSFTVADDRPDAISITPTIGSAGTTTTISGTNFDPSPTSNDVVFGAWMRGLVTSASATSLTVEVPPNTASGPVTVETWAGHTTTADFFVPPAPYSAEDVGFTGRMAIGTSHTITIGTPNEKGLVVFDGAAGQRISIAFSNGTLPNDASILGPNGDVVRAPQGAGSGTFFEPFLLPRTGTYTLFIDARDGTAGAITAQIYDVPPDASGTISIGGAAATMSIGTPGQNGGLTFAGSADQRISVLFSSSTMTADVSVLKPDGSVLRNPQGAGSGTFFDTLTLPVSGTYTLYFNPRLASTGSLTAQIYDTTTVVESIEVGGASVELSLVPGQIANVTFSGTASQAVTLSLTQVTIAGSDVSIKAPGGSVIAGPTLFGTAGGSLPASVTTTGTHTILVDPRAAHSGQMTLTLTASGSGLLFSDLDAPAGATVHTASRQIAGTGDAPASNAHFTGAVTSAREASSDAMLDVSLIDPKPGAALPVRPLLDESDFFTYSTDEHRTTRRSSTWWETQPRLRAAPGITALSGVVLDLAGRPLRNATLEVDGRSTTTDRRGRFILEDLGAGHHELLIQGRTASRPGRAYGEFEVRIELVAGTTTILPYVIWMPRLDTKNAVTIPVEITTEIVVTNPAIPGLELHLAPGSRVVDDEGRAVRTIGITPIPVDRPPFPLPTNVDVPIYFTIQPATAYVVTEPAYPYEVPETRYSAARPDYGGPNDPYPDRTGAWLVYPNYREHGPGSELQFWHYDPEYLEWYAYGSGHVNPDGEQVVPTRSTRIYEFTGAMMGDEPAPEDGPLGGPEDGDPVNLGTGLFVATKTDLVLSGNPSLSLTRTYRQNDQVSRAFGIGTNFSYGMFLWSARQYEQADLILPDGGRVHYVRTSPGTGYTDAVFESTSRPGMYFKSSITWNGLGWDLRLRDGTTLVFGENAPLQEIRDRRGNAVKLLRAGGQTGNISHIVSSGGRWIRLTYDGADRITQAQDNLGRTVGYAYDAGGRLWKVTDAAGGVTEYTYDAADRMTSIEDARGITFLTNEYDAAGRIIEQTQADGSVFAFAYSLGANGRISQTDVTSPRGAVRRVAFNADGFATSDTSALGTSEEQSVSYERQAGTNLVLAMVDELVRRTEFTYDTQGNVTSTARLAGTAGEVSTLATYDVTYSQLTTVTDPLDQVTSFDYDAFGDLRVTTDGRGKETLFDYDETGQLTTIEDATGEVSSFAYRLGDPVSSADPLGNTSSRFTDGGGRVLAASDANGSLTTYSYDQLNRPTHVVDPLGGSTSFTYDANGNILTLTDQRGGVTTYAYDAMDRPTSRQDQLGRTETFAYDLSGNLTETTDREGQTTTFGYDPLERQTFVGFGAQAGSPPTYESTIAADYDPVGRLTELVDSASGTISFTHDTLDRLTSEVTPAATVGYGYDLAGRRTTMTVSGQNSVSYDYDAADRLTSITQGTSSVSFAYDDAGRETAMTLPNGIVASRGYDAASRLTSLVYTLGSTTVGDLTYTHDSVGRRLTMAGSLARTSPPAALSSATYDAANRLTAWGSAAIAHDLNGNMTSDGTRSYHWSARNELTQVMTGSTIDASFAYDAVARRQSRAAGSVTTTLVYDGANGAQERDGTTVTADLLTGGIDEVFSRTDAAGTRTYLTDALGSTLALTDSTGAITTSYTYEPFGRTTTSGASSTNTVTFTGREDDPASGLIFYRARYYHPTFGRFISEDPLGFAAGDPNLYAYVGNDPMNNTDPSGMVLDTVIDVVSIGVGIGMLVTGGRKNFDENLQVLTLDVIGAFIPFVTGLGAGRRLLGASGDAARAVDDLPGGLVIGKMDDLAKPTGWRAGDHTLNLPPLPKGPGRWAQNERALQQAIDLRQPIRDVSPKGLGGYLARERQLLEDNRWTFDRRTNLWTPGR